MSVSVSATWATSKLMWWNTGGVGIIYEGIWDILRLFWATWVEFGPLLGHRVNITVMLLGCATWYVFSITQCVHLCYYEVFMHHCFPCHPAHACICFVAIMCLDPHIMFNIFMTKTIFDRHCLQHSANYVLHSYAQAGVTLVWAFPCCNFACLSQFKVQFGHCSV